MFNGNILKINAKRIFMDSRVKFLLIGLFMYIIKLCFMQVSFYIDTEEYAIIMFGYEIYKMDFYTGYDFTIRLMLMNFIFMILVLYPVEYGLCKFFKNAYFNKDEPKQIFSGFNIGYSRTLMTCMMKDIITAVGMCCFIVPGLIKRYDYYLVPFLLSDDENVPFYEVLKRSKELMKGWRMFAFSLDMSFVIWLVLGMYTYNITMLYSVPYYYLVKTQIYLLCTSQMQIKTTTV